MHASAHQGACLLAVHKVLHMLRLRYKLASGTAQPFWLALQKRNATSTVSQTPCVQMPTAPMPAQRASTRRTNPRVDLSKLDVGPHLLTSLWRSHHRTVEHVCNGRGSGFPAPLPLHVLCHLCHQHSEHSRGTATLAHAIK